MCTIKSILNVLPLEHISSNFHLSKYLALRSHPISELLVHRYPIEVFAPRATKSVKMKDKEYTLNAPSFFTLLT